MVLSVAQDLGAGLGEPWEESLGRSISATTNCLTNSPPKKVGLHISGTALIRSAKMGDCREFRAKIGLRSKVQSNTETAAITNTLSIANAIQG